jgi:hypothetical protein
MMLSLIAASVFAGLVPLRPAESGSPPVVLNEVSLAASDKTASANDAAAISEPPSPTGFEGQVWLDVVEGAPFMEFGEVPAKTMQRHVVKVRNRFSVPLRLEFGQRSCGCLQPKITPETVAPGGTAELELGLVAQPSAERQRYMARVVATALDGPEKDRTQIYTIGLALTVRIGYEVQPTEIVVQVPEGAAWEAPIFLLAHGAGEIEVRSARSEEPSWTVVPLADRPRPGATEVRVRGVADRSKNSFIVLNTNSEAQPEVWIYAFVRAVPRLFGVPSGAVLERTTADDLPFSISVRTDVSGTHDAEHWTVEVEGPETPGGLDGLGISAEARWSPGSSRSGELGVIDGVVSAGAMTRRDAVFHVVLRSASGAELLRLPIVVWSRPS